MESKYLGLDPGSDLGVKTQFAHPYKRYDNVILLKEDIIRNYDMV